MTSLPPENVRTYPRPPEVRPVSARLRVVLGGQTIAYTMRGLRVLETHHAPTYFFPREDVDPNALRPCSGRSFCEWKGRAQFYDVCGGDLVIPRAAWSHPYPTGAFTGLARYVAFCPEQMDACYVGGEPVLPQAGSGHGGWVTSNLSGFPEGARAG
ncbi:uncharacterized protein (DUF427 family) [Rhodovulum imhoffii]|uniref:Uncharacterized protein (DUF427 family) n=1 Tax=Rhodovulum imhoffii TaxID=365340 RepID=A0A2T5BQY3_9RHOB|nr:DUF427 domain-containing protein [Rhodovulum imhoffii]MBK5932589.1 hypothetical protein [Rhodovulum imhoffii]PTN01628.1 uncharacterized protein (DUF427 family) [Rhodovulum imhoffii]